MSVFKLSSIGQAAKTSTPRGYFKVKLCEKIEQFWPKELWPPSYPDLNPMDFFCLANPGEQGVQQKLKKRHRFDESFDESLG